MPAKRRRSESGGDAPSLAPGTNPYLTFYTESVASFPPDMDRLFDPALDDERREELDAAVCAVLNEDVVATYAWAVPDERALRVIAHFGPILEIGAGSGYWAALLRDRGVDTIAADLHTGGAAKGAHKPWTTVLRKGPELCAAHADRALLLVYPDDFEESADSLALSCLESYAGSTVIHVGELFGGARGDNVWGRSSADDFQVRLAELYHKVLEVPLPSWPYSRDALSVWRRTPICITDDGHYGFVPAAEELRPEVACASLRHLLAAPRAPTR